MKKVFISYSHKDEHYREELVTQLSLLKRQDVIQEWHDRKILPGSEWKQEIDKNLIESDLIILLISGDFIASEYCYEKELKYALEKHANNTAKVIPIIIRPCSWSDTSFSSIQALPKDGKPIAKWDNTDEGWLDVLNGLKKLLASQSSNVKHVDIQNVNPVLNTEFESWLTDTEIILTHSMVDKVNLSDIYVALDTTYDDRKSDISKIISTDKMIEKAGHYVLLGDEQQGKTTFLKHAFIKFLKSKVLPVYINAASVKKFDLRKTIETALKKQYENLDLDLFKSFNEKVILIDNFDQIKLNQKFKEEFLKSLNAEYEWVILTSHDSIEYISSELIGLVDYDERKLLGMGNVKREEIAKRWVMIGVEESIEDSELFQKCDELKKQLDNVIIKNIVPQSQFIY